MNVFESEYLKAEARKFRVGCVTMSRRDDPDRSRTRRRRDRSPSPQAHKARRREHNDNQVSENMDWNNLVSWQHNSGYNAANNFPMMPTNFQPTHNPTQQFQYPAINYMMPMPPDPTPSKFMPPAMPPPVTTSQPTPSPAPLWLYRFVLRKPGSLHRLTGHQETACLMSTRSITSAYP